MLAARPGWQISSAGAVNLHQYKRTRRSVKDQEVSKKKPTSRLCKSTHSPHPDTQSQPLQRIVLGGGHGPGEGGVPLQERGRAVRRMLRRRRMGVVGGVGGRGGCGRWRAIEGEGFGGLEWSRWRGDWRNWRSLDAGVEGDVAGGGSVTLVVVVVEGVRA